MGFKRQHLPFKQQQSLVWNFCLFLLMVEIVNLLTARALNHFGLLPREPVGLIGIITAPFLHGSFSHFLSNIIPVAVFSILLLQHGIVRFWLISVWVVILGGVGVWFFGRPAMHVGASGLIYGYFGYLLLAGLLSCEFKLFLVSLFVAVGYSGMIFGVLPSTSYISWESHLFGFLAGLLGALLWGRVRRR